MDPTLLRQFRQQLATWIEASLASQRLPFQRLELCPPVLTERGQLFPDMVLWINRDSQLAGSMILLPDVVDDKLRADGVALARALGLGHFTTWAPREVSIWGLDSGKAARRLTFQLPPAHRVTPDDFQKTLNELLERLKIATVTSSPTTAEFSAYYFANLCLRNLEDLAPGLTISARMAAGQTAANEWLEDAPRSKAWMSLWRILFLLWNGRLPSGLQPERLELAIHYALADLTSGPLSWLDLHEGEPPLPEGDAVRLHHLASRLRQLGWAQNEQQARESVKLLLREAGQRFDLESLHLPWSTEQAQLWVACQPPSSVVDCTLIAPRAYLAGWALKSAMENQAAGRSHGETLQSLDATRDATSAVAVLRDLRTLDRKARAARLILLRQVWPSRRFELPSSTPAWLWDALYIAGLTSEQLSLVLPHDWHRAPGIMSLWTILAERYQLAEISVSETGEQSLLLMRSTLPVTTVLVHRQGQTTDTGRTLLTGQSPGMTQAWLKGTDQVVELLRSRAIAGIGPVEPGSVEPLSWGLYIFLHTSLGGYLWQLCSGLPTLPELDATAQAVQLLGVPVPNPTILADLNLLGNPETRAIPAPAILEREFSNIFGPVPDMPENQRDSLAEAPKLRHRSTVSADQVAAKIFVDGIPRFPGHYLMHLYRPELAHYELHGPLEIAAEFFDKISLRTIGREDHTLEVSGSMLADALVLASYSGATGVDLPLDEQLLAELVGHYRSDLQRLWDNLIRECRSCEPHIQAAVKLAKKIWQQQGLPPERALRTR